MRWRNLSALGDAIPRNVHHCPLEIDEERLNPMRPIRLFLAFTAVSLVALPPLARALADEPTDQTEVKAGKAAKADAATGKNGAKVDDGIPEVNLLDAIRDRMVSVKAEGIGDGRMTLSVTNRSGKKLRVVLPPGIIAQGATGQFGGMGGMGGGGMGGGMGGGGMGGGGMGGGGMGGGGGGMFSVPSEVFPPQAPNAEKAQSSSFTNESVQSSKKKLNDAR
jgi:hypothetical protein